MIAPASYRSVYVTGTGAFLPGAPVDNDAIDRFIAPLDNRSPRIRDRVLADNGIRTRHYAIDETGRTVHSAADMGARAARACLERAGACLDDVTLLATGSSGGDAAMPGFANMLQGHLHAPPMATSSHHGVCAAGVTAALHAANAIELGTHRNALVVTSELPSRMFKRSRFAPAGYNADFDAHFLRWMLSDGAGAMLLSDRPGERGESLRLEWVHTRSFSGDYPTCMQIGHGANGDARGWLDYPSVGEAEAAGAFALRQDLRLLPNLFDVAIHEYAELVRAGRVDPDRVDHFLCHYSSERFAPVVRDLLDRARLHIPGERWYSNLAERGNTGAASIFIMLADFMNSGRARPGDQVLCFVPESGRFTVSFMLFTVAAPPLPRGGGEAARVPPPVAAAEAADRPVLARTLTELAGVWHDYRSRLWRTPLVRRIRQGEVSTADYLAWMESWIPQVREGAGWMREAAARLSGPFAPLAAVIEAHAGDEQDDYRILFDDYRRMGGRATTVEDLARNPGGEALHAYVLARARRPDPVGLLGAVYVIEGTGRRVIPALLPALKKSLRLGDATVRFLHYHAGNDAAHMERWLGAVAAALAAGGEEAVRRDIVETARDTARLYLMQMEHVT